MVGSAVGISGGDFWGGGVVRSEFVERKQSVPCARTNKRMYANEQESNSSRRTKMQDDERRNLWGKKTEEDKTRAPTVWMQRESAGRLILNASVEERVCHFSNSSCDARNLRWLSTGFTHLSGAGQKVETHCPALASQLL